MSETKKRLKRQTELRLTFLFQQLLQELELPTDYGDDKALNFKRQQVGVRLREAFAEGQALAYKLTHESQREDMHEEDARAPQGESKC